MKIWKKCCLIKTSPTHKKQARVLGEWIQTGMFTHFHYTVKLPVERREAIWMGSFAHYVG